MLIRSKLVILALCLSPSLARSAAQGLWLPSIFSDHMVLQAGQPVRLWGKDAPGTRVTASLAGPAAALESGRAVADRSGHWSLALGALPAGGPYRIEIQGGSSRVIQDVLCGELWLAAGQSNMVMPLWSSLGGAQAMAAATEPRLRFFTVIEAGAPEPRDDALGFWQICSPATARNFSAVSFYFGRELGQALDCPVGVIAACWLGGGGESWVPRRDLDRYPPTRTLMDLWDQLPGGGPVPFKGARYQLEISDLRLLDEPGSAVRVPLAQDRAPSLAFSTQGWSHQEGPLSSGTLLADGGVLRCQGWVRGPAENTLALPLRPRWGWGQGRDLGGYDFLSFRARGSGRFVLTLTDPSVDRGGALPETVFRSNAVSASAQWQDYRLPLAAFYPAPWSPDDARFDPSRVVQLGLAVLPPPLPWMGGGAYNGMIAPLAGLPLRGVIWYQGEDNADRSGDYARLLRSLVSSWRRAWKRNDLPFLDVQLPNYQGGGHWPVLRQAQAQALAGLPKTSLVVTLGAGESHRMHPRDKETVGHRLVLAALASVYGRKLEASGPVPVHLHRQGPGLVLSLAHAQGLRLAYPAPRSFEVAGQDGKFFLADAQLLPDGLRLASPSVPQPTAARYAWQDDPELDLFNGAGLPAGPFWVGLVR